MTYEIDTSDTKYDYYFRNHSDAKSQCVPQSEAIAAWEEAFSNWKNIGTSGPIFVTSDCDPCKCPQGGMADCYELMAKREETK